MKPKGISGNADWETATQSEGRMPGSRWWGEGVAKGEVLERVFRGGGGWEERVE